GVQAGNTDVTTDTSGTLSFASGSNLAIAINGTTAGPDAGGYDQLTVSGNVDLTGTNLAISGSYAPVVGDQFTIVNNTLDGGLTSGQFNGLDDDQTFHIATGALAGGF